jgi:hypothetical protein
MTSRHSRSSRDVTDVAALGRAALANLEKRRAAQKAQGAALRAEIRNAMVTYADPRPMTAKRILARISRIPLPSVRSVQAHMTAIRAEPPVLRGSDVNGSRGSVV